MAKLRTTLSLFCLKSTAFLGHTLVSAKKYNPAWQALRTSGAASYGTLQNHVRHSMSQLSRRCQFHVSNSHAASLNIGISKLRPRTVAPPLVSIPCSSSWLKSFHPQRSGTARLHETPEWNDSSKTALGPRVKTSGQCT